MSQVCGCRRVCGIEVRCIYCRTAACRVTATNNNDVPPTQLSSWTPHRQQVQVISSAMHLQTSSLYSYNNNRNNNRKQQLPSSQSATMFNILLQLCLAALCYAAPIADESLSTMSSNATQYGTGGGIVGFIVLVLDILVWSKSQSYTAPAMYNILTASQSRSSSLPAPSATSCCGLSSSSSSPSAASSSTGSSPTARSGTTEMDMRPLWRRQGRAGLLELVGMYNGRD